jgi:adenylate kinase
MAEKRTFIVLLGAPGAGKGTQAKLLEAAAQLPQVSTGDIFRFNLKHKTELGELAKSYMDVGALVPDEVTIRMVADRLQQPDVANGAIMDGFPRNLVQATAFDAMVAPYGGVAVVPMIGVDDEEVIRRITGRRSCRTCGAIYHIDYNPPKVAGVCDKDGGELFQRDDDQEATVRNRLFVYYKQTAPLIGYYYAKGLLAEVDGMQPIETVTAALKALLKV